MKRFFLYILFFGAISTVFVERQVYCTDNNRFQKRHASEKKLVVIIPSYNNAQWYKKNIDSVLSQKYANYCVLYIDDCSPDKTGKLVKKYLSEKDTYNRVKLIQNKKRVGAMANWYTAIHSCADSDIIVSLDGDDWFAHDTVLQRINKEYSDPHVWLTYGNYVTWPRESKGVCKPIPSFICWSNLFRNYPWVSTHLRTFYAALFKKIDKNDLMDNGVFLSVLCDWAMMYPMLEMAGKHICFISDVLYVYNTGNPINDSKVDLQKMLYYERVIRTKSRYRSLQGELLFKKG